MADGLQETIELDAPDQQALANREWLAERLGWVAIAAVIVLAVLGLLGPGPWGSRTTQTPDGQLSVEYYAVQRYAAPTELLIRFQKPRDAEMVKIGLSRSLADRMTPEAIVPRPESVEMQAERVVYAFQVADSVDAGRVLFRYKNESFGWLRYDVALDSSTPISISQFICP